MPELDDVIADVDVLYLLRMQRERTSEALVPSMREYTARFGLTPERAARLPEHALVMHPGPMNRGVEMAVDPTELRRSMITAQVANGVAVRMAVLYDLLAGSARIPDLAGDGRDHRRHRRNGGPQMTESIVIRGGTVVDQAGERRADVLVRDGHIVEVGPALSGDRTLDADGCLVSPGFVDLHVHLREPGREAAETIETGSRAAALGGFTAVVAMPNTEPAQDNVAVIEFVRRKGAEAGLCDVVPAGCITVGREGAALAPLGELAAAGVRLFTDDGNGVQDPLLMRRALEYASTLGITLAQHCEVSRLTEGAVMHEGCCSSHLGLPGWPALAEELMVHRDIELVRLTGGRVHLLHLSTQRSVALVRAAKADGLAVTAEAAPHHFTLTDDALRGFDPIFKVNPPLRTSADADAIVAGLADGTIDAIATDHAPHPPEAKEQPLDQAPPGMLGLETALALSLERLTAAGMSIADVVGALSWKPAAIAGLSARHGRPVAAGEPANLAVFDPDATLDGHPGAARQPQPQHALRRAGDAWPGPPHRLRRVRSSSIRASHSDEWKCVIRYDHARMVGMTRRDAALVLADGSVFEGEAIGAEAAVASGEVVFNTVLSGYQEVITDPSYAGQMIAFTNPHIGNYGVNPTDDEAVRPAARGVIVRELARHHSNHRSTGSLEDFLIRHGVPGIAGIDTRRLTRLIRDTGALPGAFGTGTEAELLAAAQAEPGTDGIDLVAQVSTAEPYTAGSGPLKIVAYDFGIKRTIVECLAGVGSVEVVPASTTAAEVLAREPDGVFLSNGPGDPEMVPYAKEAIAELVGKVPVFGICLGHQLLALALGGRTYKLPFGHHGGNHPILHLRDGTIAITSQNHNFCVDPASLAGTAVETHRNLNDGTNAGIRVLDKPAFSVQHHPEAGPGPHDSRTLFAEFESMMQGAN